MIICLTGLVGSGKTTYARNNAQDHEEIIDWDIIHKEFDIADRQVAKQIIIDLLEDAVKSDKVTWFVCNIPSPEHQELLDTTDVKYLWLYSTIPDTIENLIKRGRYGDVEKLDVLYLKNLELLKQSSKFVNQYNVEIVG